MRIISIKTVVETTNITTITQRRYAFRDNKREPSTKYDKIVFKGIIKREIEGKYCDFTNKEQARK